MLVRRGLALAAVAALPLSLLAAPLGAASADNSTPIDTAESFHRLATYPVFQNVPDGVGPAEQTVAEISSVSEDGNTVVYTDALGKRAGFVDITDPAKPVGLGSINLARPGHADDQPTSVAVLGDFLLVVVDSSGGDFKNPSGRLDVYRMSDRGDATPVHQIDLGGQPDSIAISDDKAYAAVAMENQRDEDADADGGGEEGDLPQAPAGFVQVIDLADPADPTTWTNREVPLSAADLAGVDTPGDAEPEYVDINADNQLALTLQENNGVVVIDLASGTVTNAFSAGIATVEGVDTEDDGLFDPSGTVEGPREPDSIQWVGDGLVATANEGDWKGGTRGWTVFDAATGDVVWDAGNSFEQIATRHGLHNNDRAGKKGAEPEGLAFETIGGTPFAFVGSERSNFVAVYDMTDPTAPVFRQALATTNGPEGLLPIPSRDLLVVSSEEDEPEDGIRASVAVFELGAGQPSFPSVLSEDVDGQPIGWGALSALSGDPADADTLWAASDSAYATGRIYRLDVAGTPARITEVLEVTNGDGSLADVDIEGLHARESGGFWIASEGATGPRNKVYRLNDEGEIVRTISLPKDVRAGLDKWGLEGVSAVRSGRNEFVYVALQRELEGEDVARIGRYDVREDRWTWFGYELEDTDADGDWIGLSEITAIDNNTLAVVERDKLNGPSAELKAVYTVTVPMSHSNRVRKVRKRLAVDVLPAMRAHQGWTQEKLEGLGVTADGRVFAVTDNDGLDDATGETQLLRLGTAKKLFRSGLATKSRLKASRKKIRKGKKVKLTAIVRPAFNEGKVQILDRGKVIRTKKLRDGRATLRVRLTKVGTHRLKVRYTGSPTALRSTSKVVKVTVVKKRRRR